LVTELKFVTNQTNYSTAYYPDAILTGPYYPDVILTGPYYPDAILTGPYYPDAFLMRS